MSKYRRDIDGIRAVAVSLVVLFHAHVPGFTGGFVGVDVFFVLSGYLIIGIIVRDLEVARFSLVRFFERRARRLFPAFYAMLVGSLGMAVLLLSPLRLQEFGQGLGAAVAYASNIYYWRTLDYFGTPAESRFFLHTWSLSVEEQFYLVTPLALLAVHRLLRRRYLVFLLPAVALSFVWSVWGSYRMPTSTFFLLPGRFWEMGMGGLLALGALPRIQRDDAREMLAAFGILMVVAPAFVYDEATRFPGVAALAPVLGTTLLLHTGTQGTFISRALSSRLLVWLGLVSYSFYLWHWPVLLGGRLFVPRSLALYESLALVGVSLALAVVSYRWIEQPFRVPSSSPTSTRPLIMAVVGALASFGLASGLVFSKGLPQRFPGYEITKIHAGGHDRCPSNARPGKWPADRCLVSRGPGPKVLVWGDSFAGHYKWGVNQADVAAQVLFYTLSRCAPLLDHEVPGRPSCARFNSYALTILEEQDVDTVLLVGEWTMAIESVGLATVQQKLRHTIHQLTARGVDVKVIGQSPVFSHDVQHLFLRSGRPPVAVGTQMLPELEAVNGRLRQASSEASAFIDPLETFCRGALCTYKDEGGYLFADQGHLSKLGSLRAVEAYFPYVRK